MLCFSRSVDSTEGETEKESLRKNLRLKLAPVADMNDCSEKSPSSVKDVILASSKSILGKVLSPTKEKFANKENNREKVRTPLCASVSILAAL